ncbi:hypothetical protein QAD02_014923 [Eretmocerus hayati]|uniref:Uncharacterized protein n=1 Tax=Eretmocerus hayati TaxID=131215 RepID=A0ACC2P8F0_9HYME|nr:hypothetical protein QAD02_014923 [Eretmocerus hayati]
MKRGPYKGYTRDPSLPIPNSTERSRSKRARTLEEIRCPDSSDEEGEIQRLVQNNHPVTENHRYEVLPGAVSDPSVSYRMSASPVNNQDSNEESSSESDSEDVNGPSFAEFIFSDGETEDSHTFPAAPDLDTVPIFNLSKVNKKESHMIIMACSLRHKLPNIAIDHWAKVIDLHLPSPIHKSKYLVLKPIPDSGMVRHYFCGGCKKFIDEIEGMAYCKNCKEFYEIKDLKDRKWYFLQMPIKKQIQEMLQSEIYLRLRKDCSETDIVSSGVYREKVRRGIIGVNDISISWNVDGMNFRRNSPSQPWTIVASVNELNYRDRKKNIMLCEFWEGDHQPSMELFLDPFLRELKELSSEGFMTSVYQGEEEILVKVHTICAPIDTMARYKCQHMTTCRGEYGCSICFHPGQIVEVGRGTARVYPFQDCDLRTLKVHQEIFEAMERSQIDRMLGLYGPSMVSTILGEDPIYHFPPEYLHMGPLGSIKAFAESWFDPANREKPFYLGHKLKEFNKRLRAIKPPTELTRVPKEFGKNYNGNDWKNFALYYSLPCLRGIMKPKYLKHWSLLVYGYHVFLQDQLNHDDCVKGQEAFNKFVREIPKLYGLEHARYNAHLHTHILQFVKAFGALWAWSAFMFEGFNGILKFLTHGTQYMGEQVCAATCRIRYLRNNAHIFSREDCNVDTVKIFIMLMEQCRVKNCIEYKEKLRMFGKPQGTELILIEKIEIEELLDGEVEEKCETFTRFIYDHMLIHSSSYQRLKKRKNSFIITENNEIFDIQKIVRVQKFNSRKTRYIILGKEVEILDQQLCENQQFSSEQYSYIVKETNNIRAFKPKLIRSKCVRVFIEDGLSCIIPLVNKQETD